MIEALYHELDQVTRDQIMVISRLPGIYMLLDKLDEQTKNSLFNLNPEDPAFRLHYALAIEKLNLLRETREFLEIRAREAQGLVRWSA